MQETIHRALKLTDPVPFASQSFRQSRRAGTSSVAALRGSPRVTGSS